MNLTRDPDLKEIEAYRDFLRFDPKYQDPRILERSIAILESGNARLKYIRPLRLKLQEVRKATRP